MKKTLFFASFLTIFGFAKAMDNDSLKPLVKNKAWTTLCDMVVDGNYTIADMFDYNKSHLDALDDGKFTLFQRIITTLYPLKEAAEKYEIHMNLRGIQARPSDNPSLQEQRLRLFLEALIVSDKVTHDKKLIYYNNEIRLYHHLYYEISTHKSDIQKHITKQDWPALTQYIIKHNISAPYLVQLNSTQRELLFAEFDCVTTNCLVKIRQLLKTVQEDLQELPALQVPAERQENPTDTRSFAFDKTHYLIGGVLVAIAAALIYTFYSSSSQEKEDEADGQAEEKPSESI